MIDYWGWFVWAALLIGLVGWRWHIERKDNKAFFEKMRDPEFRRQHHEMHKNDDWEDLGYFDGR